MSIARRSCGTCGHGMWTLGSQVVGLAENGVRVIVPGSPGRGRCVARWPGHAWWRRPPRRRRVRALQQLRCPGISRRVSRPPYHQSYAGKSAGGDDAFDRVRLQWMRIIITQAQNEVMYAQNCRFEIMRRKCVCLVVRIVILIEIARMLMRFTFFPF